MTMFPNTLQPGDIVEIIAPAAKCDPSILTAVKDFLAEWGLRAHIPENLFGEDILCANTEALRLQLLTTALTNPHSKAVWSLKGGYGSGKLLPALKQLPKPATQKLLLGFSDITALHIFLQQQWGWSTVHGPQARQIPLKTVNNTSREKVKDLLLNPAYQDTYTLKPLNQYANTANTIIAPITGGNLCLVLSSLATFWQIDTRNKIVFIEEVNEPAYKVDRMLEQLLQAGLLSEIKALIIGDFMPKDEKDLPLLQQVLQRWADNLALPVLSLAEAGHGLINYPVPLGCDIELQLGSAAKLRFGR